VLLNESDSGLFGIQTYKAKLSITMTQRNNLTTQPIHPASLGKRMLQGAGIAFILIVNRKKV
jgi:hypothetical protein